MSWSITTTVMLFQCICGMIILIWTILTCIIKPIVIIISTEPIGWKKSLFKLSVITIADWLKIRA